jgi:hypothetical protein
VEILAYGMVHGAAYGREGVRQVSEHLVESEFLSEDVTACSVEMGDDHALVVVETRGTPPFRAAFEVIGIKTGQNQELIGALEVEEKAFVATGAVNGLHIVDAVKAFHLALGFVALQAGAAAEVGADDGDVVGQSDLGDADAFEGVAYDEEEKELRREQGKGLALQQGVEELGVVQDEGDGIGIFAERSETIPTAIIEGKGFEDELPVHISEPEPAAGAGETHHRGIALEFERL